MVIGHLDLGDTTITDNLIPIKEFSANKHKHGGEFGQLPVLVRPDGKFMGQTCAIIRFLSQKHKAKTGECLYPAHADPMTSYWIDFCLEKNDLLV